MSDTLLSYFMAPNCSCHVSLINRTFRKYSISNYGERKKHLKWKTSHAVDYDLGEKQKDSEVSHWFYCSLFGSHFMIMCTSVFEAQSSAKVHLHCTDSIDAKDIITNSTCHSKNDSIFGSLSVLTFVRIFRCPLFVGVQWVFCENWFHAEGIKTSNQLSTYLVRGWDNMFSEVFLHLQNWPATTNGSICLCEWQILCLKVVCSQENNLRFSSEMSKQESFWCMKLKNKNHFISV